VKSVFGMFRFLTVGVRWSVGYQVSMVGLLKVTTHQLG
jgi:hypothetical protein